MSVPPARVSSVAERWDRERVLALAPDAPSQRTAQSLASGRAWPATGAGTGALWGECRGSAAAPYRAVVDLSGPAYRCSCPSRRFPCKHVLALLLLWAEGAVRDDAAGPPDWAANWLTTRAARASRAPSGEPAEPKDPKAAARRARAARDPGGVRPGRARPVALRPGAAGSRRQPAGRLRPLGRHRRQDGRRASPRPGRASPRPRLCPAFGRGLGRPAPRGVRAAPPARGRLPPPGRAAAAAAGDRQVPDRLQPPPGRRAGRRPASQGPLAGTGPPGPRAGPDPGPPDVAARPQDRPRRAAAQLRGGRASRSTTR